MALFTNRKYIRIAMRKKEDFTLQTRLMLFSSSSCIKNQRSHRHRHGTVYVVYTELQKVYQPSSNYNFNRSSQIPIIFGTVIAE